MVSLFVFVFNCWNLVFEGFRLRVKQSSHARLMSISVMVASRRHGAMKIRMLD